MSQEEQIPEYKKSFRSKNETPKGNWVLSWNSNESDVTILGPLEEEGKMRQLIATVHGVKTSHTNAERIVQAVNACQDIPDINAYSKDRDRLIDACKLAIKELLNTPVNNQNRSVFKILERAILESKSITIPEIKTP